MRDLARPRLLWAWGLAAAGARRPGRQTQLEDLVAQGGGPFELEVFGGLEHLGFKGAQVFLGVIRGLVAPDGPAGDAACLDLFLDSAADRFLDRFGGDAVLGIVLQLEQSAAAGSRRWRAASSW